MATITAPGLKGAVARFWQRSYAPDYVGYAMLQTAYLMIQFFVEPFHRMFSLDDRSKSYPHAAVERVSALQNIIYAGIVPVIFLFVWAFVFRPGVHKAHITILGFLISVTLASFITDVIKNAVGRPRPDLIARCKPRPGTPSNALVTIDVCTETDHHVLHDGWRSFPSGHSSFSFAGLGYVALFFAGQLHVFRPGTDLARVLVALAPLLGAGLIAMSRLADYRHDVWDVTCGSVLGISIAYFSYRRYFRRLRDGRCDEPYPSRAQTILKQDATVVRGRKARDEEEGRLLTSAHRAQQRHVADAEEFELDDIDEEDDRAENAPLNTALGTRV